MLTGELCSRVELVYGVCEVAGAVVKEKDGGGLFGGVCGGDPPGGEAWCSGGAGVKADRLKGDGGGALDLCRWMEQELPGALPDEQADGEIGADNRGEDGEREGLEDPAGVDDLGKGLLDVSAFRGGECHRYAWV